MSVNVYPLQSPTSVINDQRQLDAFARLRVSNPETIFDSKQLHNAGALVFDDQQVSGASTTSTWSQDTASTILGVGAATINANTVGTRYALCGLRLKTANPDGAIKLRSFSTMTTTADDYLWEVIFNPVVAGTPSWTAQLNSVVEFGLGDTAGNPSATTITGGTVMASGYVKASVTSGGDVSLALDSAQQLGIAINGTTRDTVWLSVIPLAANADMSGSLSWQEIS